MQRSRIQEPDSSITPDSETAYTEFGFHLLIYQLYFSILDAYASRNTQARIVSHHTSHAFLRLVRTGEHANHRLIHMNADALQVKL